MTDFADMALEDQIKWVENRIAEAAVAQEYTQRGRTNRRASLNHLYELRDRLKRELQVANTNAGSMATVGQINRPR